VKIIPEPSTTRYMAFKVIRSNIEIAITLPRLLDCVQIWGTEFYHVAMFMVKGQGHCEK